LAIAATWGVPAVSAQSESTLAPFKVAIADIDYGAVPILATVEAMQAAGHPVEFVEVADPELGIECVARNECQFNGGATSPGLLAIQAGAPMKIFADYIGNQWSFYSDAEIAACADLDGKRIGIFSEGAVATAMLRNWINVNCPDINPEYLVIGGSEVRYAALLADQIDATALELSDAVVLEAETGDDYNLLASFIDDLPELKSGVYFGNADFMAANPETVAAYVTELMAQHQRMNEDPAYFKELILKYLPDSDPDTLDAVIQKYRDFGVYDAGSITPENIAYTIDFFIDAGVLEDGMTADAVADFTYLDLARGG
jgi:NitT/TauT family transport system substrate-binding protein